MTIETARDRNRNGSLGNETGGSIRSAVAIFVATCLLANVGCTAKTSGEKGSSDNGLPTVVSTNYPLHFFVQEIGGDYVTAVFSVADDGETGDPAYWKPSAAAVTTMQKADLIITNSASYESWLNMVTLPESSVVRTADSFQTEWIIQQGGVTHQHGPDGEADAHGTTAFTTWLDLDHAIEQARNICVAMGKLRPKNHAIFEANFAALEKRLRDLNKQLVEIGTKLDGEHLIASPPVYQYLQKSLKLNLHSVLLETNAEPTAEQWAEFDTLLQENPTTIMLWEDEPTAATSKQLEERGIRVVVFNPLANQPAIGDFMTGMQQNIDRLKESITN